MRNVININRGWAFQKAAPIPKDFPQDWERVDLPHTWNAVDGQDGGNDYWRGKGVYARQITAETVGASIARPLAADGRPYCVFLEVNGCNASADVYLNGTPLCHHDGGYSTFRVELPALTGDDLLVVVADNSVSDRVYPQQADFTFYGGLYRDVNLILVSETHFELVKDGTPGLRVCPKQCGADWQVTVDTWQNGGTVEFTVNGETKCVPSEDGHAAATFLLKNARLWDGVHDPYLYEAKAVLRGGKGEKLDEISTPFGCRTVRIDPQEGFFLNGKPYPLRGVSRHQDRWGLGNALTKKEHDEDMALIRELGANSVRLAHYQHDQYFYDLCDRCGLVAWAEIPYISSHMPNGRENTFSQMRELITQNYNHPAVVVWGLSNEITMTGLSDDLRDNHTALNALVKRMDPDRPTVMANVMMLDIHDPLLRLPDATAYNLYFGWYVGKLEDNEAFFDTFHRENPDVPVGFTEYGCDTNPAFHTAAPQRGDYTEEYQRVYHEHILSMVEARPWLWCSYAWNMFDFAADAREEGGSKGLNQKGLVSFDRKLKKDVFYLYKAYWTKEPFLHLCGRRYVNRTEAVTDVTVYSNQGEITLLVDGKPFGAQSGSRVFRFRVPLTGEHRIEAVSGDLRDEICVRRVNEQDMSYVNQGGGILNWFDASGLKEDYYNLKDRVCDLMASPGAAAVVLDCVRRTGKDETEFILDLRDHPEKLETLELTMEEVLSRTSPFISSNIKRYVNAKLQQIKRT